MRDNIYFKYFQASLTDQQKQEYRDMSINQQKDWYISYLENKDSLGGVSSRMHVNAMDYVMRECISKGFSKLAKPTASFVAQEVKILFNYSLRVSDNYTLQNMEQ